jgi:rhodanese-related sulfurtransferase
MIPGISSLSSTLFGLLLIAITGCGHAQGPQKTSEGGSQDPIMKDVSVAEFHELMASMPNALLLPRDRPVLVYCAGGGRSGLTAKELNAAGHQEVYNLEDGITGWKREGMPVVTGPPAND